MRVGNVINRKGFEIHDAWGSNAERSVQVSPEVEAMPAMTLRPWLDSNITSTPEFQEPTPAQHVGGLNSARPSDRMAVANGNAAMADILWALVIIGGPTLVTAAMIYGLLIRRSMNVSTELRPDLSIKNPTDKPEF